ncbi:MAG TPA: zinc ribbon domain-containing protein [Opitutaceae bacterium]|nr:zinc ribbon domain-containing protein [Opitutaceae bacterium]
MPPAPPPPDACAQCGAAIPRGARACPECGADERTGWREASVYDGLDLPDEAGSEPGATQPRRHAPAWYWLAAGLLVLFLFALRALRL